MNPGLFEEVGKATNTLIEAFKATPLMLALVIMNIVLLVYLFWYSANVLDQRAKTTALVTGMIIETNKSLSSCVSNDVIQQLVEAVKHSREMQRPPLPAPPPP